VLIKHIQSLLCRNCHRHRESDNKKKRRATEALPDDASRNLRAKMSAAPEPAITSRKLRDRTSVVPDSATSSFAIETPEQKSEVDHNIKMLRLLRANNISDVTVLEKSAAMLRLLQANGVSDVSMLEELLRKACQPEALPVCSATSVNNNSERPETPNPNAGRFSRKELEPKLLNKQWDAISEILRRAVFEFVGAANVNGNLQAQLSNAQGNADLSRLYESLFGTDPEEQSRYQNDKLCKIYHVLWAMLGKIVYLVMRSENVKVQMLDFVDGVDPRLEILAKSVEQEGMSKAHSRQCYSAHHCLQDKPRSRSFSVLTPPGFRTLHLLKETLYEWHRIPACTG